MIMVKYDLHIPMVASVGTWLVDNHIQNETRFHLAILLISRIDPHIFSVNPEHIQNEQYLANSWDPD